jgi:hypothetical protein
VSLVSPGGSIRKQIFRGIEMKKHPTACSKLPKFPQREEVSASTLCDALVLRSFCQRCAICDFLKSADECSYYRRGDDRLSWVITTFGMAARLFAFFMEAVKPSQTQSLVR